MPNLRENILAALRAIKDPQTGDDIVTAGLVKALMIENGTVRFVLEIDPATHTIMEAVRSDAQAAAEAVTGVQSVSAILTAHSTKKAPADLAAHGMPKLQGPQKIPQVKRVIAIGSGKGGVGKSTVAANMAIALAARGLRVGLLDADVYGPSLPRLMGISERPGAPKGRSLIPPQKHGVTLMSMGLMTQEKQAVIWRGPLLAGALQQMLSQVQWGALDVLFIDLPPGTGDVITMLAQKVTLDGALIVSTPQDVALMDVRKAVDMFGKLKVPVLGMIENMSTHICSECGHEEHTFGHGGVAREAAEMDVPLLAELPLHMDIRRAGDNGAPIGITRPESPEAKAFDALAATIMDKEIVPEYK